jgi:hypothetical protein
LQWQFATSKEEVGLTVPVRRAVEQGRSILPQYMDALFNHQAEQRALIDAALGAVIDSAITSAQYIRS